jgi:hypothetical protein
MKCAFCGNSIQIEDKVTRYDTCKHCGGDLRCCRQCRFYDQNAYNECKEIIAERVTDKDRSNFCGYFLIRDSPQRKVDPAQDAKDALEALFKKR